MDNPNATCLHWCTTPAIREMVVFQLGKPTEKDDMLISPFRGGAYGFGLPSYARTVITYIRLFYDFSMKSMKS